MCISTHCFSIRKVVLLIVLFVLCSCSPPVQNVSTPSTTPSTITIPTSTPSSALTPTPSPQARSKLTPTEIKYRLADELGTVFFCDPDLYPVARVIDEQEFERRFSEIEKNGEVFQAILKHKGLSAANLSSEQKRAIYADYKMLNAINLKPADDQYQFSLRVVQAQKSGFAIEGRVDPYGVITVTKKESTITTCPICLSGNTLIDTPSGPVLVKELKVGMSVWTSDQNGVRQEATIVETARRALPIGTPLVHIVLDDRREVLASPGHPLIDGRTIGELVVGDLLDGGNVVLVEQITYDDGATYDLLPSGTTGSYWANGILLKSTLRR